MKNFQDVLAAARKCPPKKIAVAMAHDREVLEAIQGAKTQGLADAVLIGDIDQMQAIAQEIGMDLSQFELVEERDPLVAVRQATVFVRTQRADMVMKGKVGTADVLRAVLNKEAGLRTGRHLSHVAIFEAPGYDRLMFMTDGGINIAPTLTQKVDIINNAVCVAQALGIALPKVAAIAGLELVNPDMPATIEAALLAKMNDRGQITGCLVDGPLALDLALSREAADHKGVKSSVAGGADILLVPNLETGNVLYKSLVFFGKAKIGSVVAGAAAPVVVTSRSDSHEAKLVSIALGVLMANTGAEGRCRLY